MLILTTHLGDTRICVCILSVKQTTNRYTEHCISSLTESILERLKSTINELIGNPKSESNFSISTKLNRICKMEISNTTGSVRIGKTLINHIGNA